MAAKLVNVVPLVYISTAYIACGNHSFADCILKFQMTNQKTLRQFQNMNKE